MRSDDQTGKQSRPGQQPDVCTRDCGTSVSAPSCEHGRAIDLRQSAEFTGAKWRALGELGYGVVSAVWGERHTAAGSCKYLSATEST